MSLARFRVRVAASSFSRPATTWRTAAATDDERRKLLDELLSSMKVLPYRLVVEVRGAPPLLVGLDEVGLKPPPDSDFRGVGGGT